ncbi:4Fe-4S binding protein [Thermogladius sp. 4427co]|uniref:4Fe-4S binding protein n=1 Tax=Thermogladius sp. 4427co TaxID=3450718 RepID=UPI003F7A6429
MVLSTIIKSIEYLFRKPYTRLVPAGSKPFKTERLRGSHILDMEKCTGCSMCQLVCPANAIDMVEVEGNYPHNPRRRFPRIDLHKCTFCALCVEYCPFNALYMTDITGFELYTRDKRTTLKNPLELSRGDYSRITVRREMFMVREEVKRGG